METVHLHEDEREQAQHTGVIWKLAEQMHLEEDDVRCLYESILMDYKKEATVNQYHTILVSRDVLERIQEKDADFC